MSSGALYVSPVAGHLVERPGTGARGRAPVYIGAARDPADPTIITWREHEIVAISPAEQMRHAREYRRLLADGALRRRTEAEHAAETSAAAAADRPRPNAAAADDSSRPATRS